MRFGRCPSGTMMGSVPRLWRSISQRMGLSTLVLAEQKGGRLDPSTAQAVSAARALGGPVTLLFSGRGLGGAPSAGAALEGVTAVLTADDEALDHQLAEPAGALIVAVQQRRSFTHILAPSSTHGRNLLPRAAAKLDVQAVADVVEVRGPCTFVRPIYAGNALATVETPAEGLQMLTVRTTSFPPAPARAGNPAAIEPVSAEELQAAKVGCVPGWSLGFGPACDPPRRGTRARLPHSQADAGTLATLSPTTPPSRPPNSLARTRPAPPRGCPRRWAPRSAPTWDRPGWWSPAGARCAPRRTLRCWRPWPTRWGGRWAPRVPRWTPATCPTTSRSARRARWWPRTCTWPLASPAPSSTWPGSRTPRPSWR
ncbi:ETFA1 [Auxenochlorella protothecoides x Auxenochlorella symbiontica]